MRFDNFLVEKNYFDSRTKAHQAIKRGEVYINGILITKPSHEIDERVKNEIKVIAQHTFVSLGGYKLNKAVETFSVNVEGKIVCDVGASTGGFTDCLLQNGAKKVFAVDLNDELLHSSLKKDERVVTIIKNARFLDKSDFDDEIEFLSADLSFISATQVMKTFYDILSNDGYAIILIKPQFETGEKRKFKNGIIKDEEYRLKACREVYDCAISVGFSVVDLTTAPEVKGKNIEYLILLKKNDLESLPFDKLFNKNIQK